MVLRTPLILIPNVSLFKLDVSWLRRIIPMYVGHSSSVSQILGRSKGQVILHSTYSYVATKDLILQSCVTLCQVQHLQEIITTDLTPRDIPSLCSARRRTCLLLLRLPPNTWGCACHPIGYAAKNKSKTKCWNVIAFHSNKKKYTQSSCRNAYAGSPKK